MTNFFTRAWVGAGDARRCFQLWGKGANETEWRVIDLYATARRDADSPWPAPFWRGTCITWGAAVIEVGWDFARLVYQEQAEDPASRDRPVRVAAGRLTDVQRRSAAGARPYPTASEILAHECGHTAQARRMGLSYWPIGATFTLFREGHGFWHAFENEASEHGVFGGIVNGSVREGIR